MQHRVALAASAAVAVVALVAVALLQGAASGSPSSQAEFNETEVRHALGRESETWRTRIYTRAGKFAGSGVVACVPTSTADSLQQCTGTYALPRGRVAVAGLISSRAGFNFVVLGGTDAYLGARGSLVVSQTSTNGPRHARLTFFFE